MNRLLNKIISKIKGEEYKIDENITIFNLIGIVLEKIIMLIRGMWNKLFFKKSKGILFIGKRTKFKSYRKIQFLGNATIDDNCMINALSRDGIKFGKNFSLGRNSIIECTGVIRNLGDGLEIEDNVRNCS